MSTTIYNKVSLAGAAKVEFRTLSAADVSAVVEIVRSAQRRLKADGVDQWQNGYPNRERVEEDLRLGYGRVLCCEGEVVAYGALTYDGESAYDALRGGKWLTEKGVDYLTVHRLCVAEGAVGGGYGRLFMLLAEKEAAPRVGSIRVDTHPDNGRMQGLVGSLGYSFCGTVVYESPRWAYEKILTDRE